MAETFFASLEKELLRRERFETCEQARMRIFWYIEAFYNTRPRHTSLGGISRKGYEQRYHEQANAA
jgi:putative transposase